MNLRDEWRERVAEVVAAHECLYERRAYPAFECSCGKWNGAQGDDGGDMDGRSDNAYAHARHAADALLAEGGVVTVHHEDGSYWAEVEELPGCFASGASMDELWEALQEAIEMYVSTPQNPPRSGGERGQ